MVLSKREQYVAAGTVVVLALLAGNYLLLNPLLARRAEIKSQREKLQKELARNRNVLARRQQVGPLWEAMQRALPKTPTDAETQVFHIAQDAAEEAGLSLPLLKPERLAEKGRLPQISFQATGTGNMRAVSRFLWRLEVAQVPLRVTELQLGSRKEGTDDLTVQLRLTTLHVPEKTQAAAGVAPAGKGKAEASR